MSIQQIKQAFRIPAQINITRASQYSIPVGETPDPELYRSSLGTPVYADITFKSVQYSTDAGDSITTDDITYYAVLLTVDQAKKIIRTEIQGRNGTVKEYIGMDDYQIKIQGVITASNGVHPRNEIAKLKKMLDAPVPIPVVSAYLQNMGINYLVVNSYSLGQEAGGYSYQTFSIDAISDEPQQIVLSA